MALNSGVLAGMTVLVYSERTARGGAGYPTRLGRLDSAAMPRRENPQQNQPTLQCRPMSKPLPDPHDRFFRETFSRREVAEGFLRGYLPQHIVDGIRWDTLAIAKDSFIEKALRNHFSDLLYTARHKNREIKIYLLVEHKSHPDTWVPLQLLRYQVRIWELHRKQHPKKPLPPILPLVLYHGQPRWQGPDDFKALFGETDAALSAYIPNVRHEFCDLALPEPAAIKGAVLSRLCLLALKHIFDPEPKQALAEILPLVRDILERDTALEMLEVVLRYYVQATQMVTLLL